MFRHTVRIGLCLCYMLFYSLNIMSEKELYFENLTVEKGLSSNYIECIYRDSIGFVWIGTTKGIDRFDGYNIKNYPLYNRKNKSVTARINAICNFYENNLIVASDIGIFKYDRTLDSLEFITPIDLNVPIISIYQAQANLYILGSRKGLFLVNKNMMRLSSYLQQEAILAIQSYHNKLLILTPHKLYTGTILKEQQIQFSTILTAPKNIRFSTMAQQNEQIFIGTEKNGIYETDLNTKKLKKLEAIKANLITSIFLSQKQLFVGSDGAGLIIYDTVSGKIRNYIHSPQNAKSIASNSIYSILTDQNGIYWIGTYSSGVSFSQQYNTLFQEISDLKGNSIRSFHIIDSSRIIVGTRNGLIYKDGHNKYTFSSQNTPFIKSNITLSISPYISEKYLIGTYGGGLYLFDTQKKEPEPFFIKDNRLLEDESIYGSAFLNGKIYLATLNGLIIIKENKIEKQLTDKNSELPSSLIYNFTPDSLTLWLGTSRGVARYNILSEEIENIQFTNYRNDFRTNYIYKDSKGCIWLCGNEVGIIRYFPQNGSIELLGNKLGISPDHISGIVEDGNHHDYWVSSGNGFFRYNSSSGEIQSYNRQDGLPHLSFCPGACIRQDNNTIYFGSERGMVYFCPDSIQRNAPTAHIVITNIQVKGKDLRLSDKKNFSHLTLNAGENFSVTFTNANFKRAYAGHYKYLLQNHSTEWESISGNKITFDNLQAGYYSLLIKHNPDGINWSPETKILSIHIKTPFYQSKIFIIIGGILLLSVFLLSWKWKNKIKIILTAIKSSSKLVNRKKGIAESEKIEQQLNAIKIFMEKEKPYLNPHFSIKDIADGTGYTVHEISMALNDGIKQNFFDFVNRYRVEAIKIKLIGEEANYLTLHSLAEECGFNSKTSFYRIFKKVTGYTPMEYRKKYLESQPKQTKS